MRRKAGLRMWVRRGGAADAARHRTALVPTLCRDVCVRAIAQDEYDCKLLGVQSHGAPDTHTDYCFVAETQYETVARTNADGKTETSEEVSLFCAPATACLRKRRSTGNGCLSCSPCSPDWPWKTAGGMRVLTWGG
eukprot:364537-Chlamydomonas_euryale.AAC.3